MGADRQRDVDEGLYEKWQEWIERIYREVVTLFAYRSFYRGLAEMTQANDAIPASSFFDALAAWYGTTQSMGVRRQTDLGRDAISLAAPLTNMAAHPQVMTRERFLALWDADEHDQRRGNEEFDRYAGSSADRIEAERYQADLDCFQQTARPTKDYVDRLVAHNDQRELDRMVTYEELNAAIDLLEELVNKYMVLLKAIGVPSADPVHQADWKNAFRIAWLKD